MPIDQAIYHGKDANHQLRTAALYGDPERVRALLAAGSVDINFTDRDGSTALFHAAQNGRLEVVEILLRHGADVHIVCCHGATALMQAEFLLHSAVVDVLVRAGAGFHRVMSMASYAREAEKASLEEPPATDLMRAAYAGDKAAVDALLQDEKSIDAVNGGWNAMMCALSKGHFGIANSLVRPHTTIHDGELMLAANYGVDQVITEMVAEHPKILQLSLAGPRWTPVMLAVLQADDYSNAAEILVDAAIAQLLAVPAELI